jgi:hypothetical protein
MMRTPRWLPPSLRLLAAAYTAALFIGTTPAAADSVFFGYSSGYGHRQHHRHHHHWHQRHHYGPRYHYGYYHYPPVYYPPPPPRVVYVPAPPPVMSAVPTSPIYRAPNGEYCREYQSTVTIDGQPQPSYGTACQQPDGSWRVVN